MPPVEAEAVAVSEAPIQTVDVGSTVSVGMEGRVTTTHDTSVQSDVVHSAPPVHTIRARMRAIPA